MANFMTDLQKTRAAVDEIDREIAELFEKRMRLTEDIAEYKLEHGMRVVDPEREVPGITESTWKQPMISAVLKVRSSRLVQAGLRRLL